MKLDSQFSILDLKFGIRNSLRSIAFNFQSRVCPIVLSRAAARLCVHPFSISASLYPLLRFSISASPYPLLRFSASPFSLNFFQRIHDVFHLLFVFCLLFSEGPGHYLMIGVLALVSCCGVEQIEAFNICIEFN